jgi:hypothetical protein
MLACCSGLIEDQSEAARTYLYGDHCRRCDVRKKKTRVILWEYIYQSAF